MNRWYGKILGLLAGAALFRPNPLVGALIGLLIGHAFDADWFRGPRENPWRVLGLTDEASDAEVDLASRRLITQSHPDNLSGVADDLRRPADAPPPRTNPPPTRPKPPPAAPYPAPPRGHPGQPRPDHQEPPEQTARRRGQTRRQARGRAREINTAYDRIKTLRGRK